MLSNFAFNFNLRRYSVELDVCERIAREIGLDPAEIIQGDEPAERLSGSEDLYGGRTTQVKFVPMWKAVVAEKVGPGRTNDACPHDASRGKF